MTDPTEYYMRGAIIEQTLNGSVVTFTHGEIRPSDRRDKVYIIFERGDKKLQAAVEVTGSVQRVLIEEEVQALRQYVKSLQEL